MDQGRGRGRGRPRGTPSRSAGRQFRGSAAHSHRRYDPQSGGSSRGRRGKFVYVPKRQEGPNSPDATTGVSEEASSVIASGLGHNGIGNSPLFSSPLGFSSHTDEGKTMIEHISRELKCNEVTKTSDFPYKLDISCQQVEDTLPLKHGDTDEDGPLSIKDPKPLASDGKSENSKSAVASVPFDICPPKTSAFKLKPPLLVQNRERKIEMKRPGEGLSGKILRSGMVLLKNYISPSDQAKIVKRCHDLGLGHGGFYQPGYREGAKLHLNMMCLGKNWDPQTGKYEDYRPTDGAKPPVIPMEFYELVKKALKDSHSVIERDSEGCNAEKLLPYMTPDICLVNFYSTNGRLGLHQDRDESRESIREGLPVVSFSIGDTAEFKYGEERDVDKAEVVFLESGDVLIFGGVSRNVFHGVTAIRSNTAPKSLLEETNLRAGRLNLTFRQY